MCLHSALEFSIFGASAINELFCFMQDVYFICCNNYRLVCCSVVPMKCHWCIKYHMLKRRIARVITRLFKIIELGTDFFYNYKWNNHTSLLFNKGVLLYSSCIRTLHSKQCVTWPRMLTTTVCIFPGLLLLIYCCCSSYISHARIQRGDMGSGPPPLKITKL